MVRLTKEVRLEIEQYILNGIISEDQELNTDKEKLQYAYNHFKAEYGFNIERMGQYKAFSEWLSGLALDYDFYNFDILKLAEKWGQNVETEKQQQFILDNYWDFLTNQFFKLCKKNKIEVL